MKEKEIEICCKCQRYTLDEDIWFEMNATELWRLKYREGYEFYIGYCQSCGIKAYKENFEVYEK